VEACVVVLDEDVLVFVVVEADRAVLSCCGCWWRRRDLAMSVRLKKDGRVVKSRCGGVSSRSHELVKSS
jgi:hypothetical protein